MIRVFLLLLSTTIATQVCYGQSLSPCERNNATILGTDASETITGTPGNDVIHAGAGNDIIDGLGGDDLICAGDGNDTVNGQLGNDIIFGQGGNDIINGGSDGDVLIGGEGVDTCAGGSTGSDEDIASSCESVSGLNIRESPSVIMFVMLDDADFFDVGFNSPTVRTPNIDSIARDGMTFSQFYASAGICSPTRASILTGQNPTRFGLNRLFPKYPVTTLQTTFGLRGLPQGIANLSDLKHAGYHTAQFGKWHVGQSKLEHDPLGKGFDHYLLMNATPLDEDAYNGGIDQWRVEENRSKFLLNNKWRPIYIADRVIEYIDQNWRDRPVFINWWPLVPHTPLGIPPGYDNSTTRYSLRSDRGKLQAMMTDWDSQFGRVLNYLKSNGLYENSLIIFTSDNGGYRFALDPSRKLSGSKNSLLDGGIKVPFAASWPNKISRGTRSNQVVTAMDIFPSLSKITGLPLELQNDDGLDMSAAFFGRAVRRDKPVFWQQRLYSDTRYQDNEANDSYALREGCWKLHKSADTNEYKLFHICSDLNEKNNLARRFKGVVKTLKNKLRKERLDISNWFKAPEISALRVLPFDERIDTHIDDFSLYFTLDTAQAMTTPKQLYRRGQVTQLNSSNPPPAIDIKLLPIGNSGKNLSITLRGVDANAQLVTKSFTTSLPNDGQLHRIGIAVTGYLRDYSVVEVFIDGVLTNTLRGQQSVYAIYSDKSDARIGSSNFSILNYGIYVTAIRPQDFAIITSAPDKVDIDNDGVPDYLDNDDDGDDLPDSFEAKNDQFSQIDRNDGEADSDGDGFSNGREFLAGTDMNDPNSFPKVKMQPSIIDLLLGSLNLPTKYTLYPAMNRLATVKTRHSQL